MNIGIVGHEAKKFTPETEEIARDTIRGYLRSGVTIVSGQCHLGGIDIWAVEEATKAGYPVIEYPPEVHIWDGTPQGKVGYKQRNELIVHNSTELVCIVVEVYPPDYKGMTFNYCYHCKTNDHIKSGGCWTMKYAAKLGKQTHLEVI